MVSLIAALVLMPQQQFRPPAVPLITHDPYFSIWSLGDKLTDDWTKHWTGKNQAMVGMIRVDGKTYRWMSRGLEDLPAAEQKSFEVLPSKTVYRFEAGGIELQAEFVGNQNILQSEQASRSDSALRFAIKSLDGKLHRVSLYVDCSAELVVDNPRQRVQWSRFNLGLDTVAMWHAEGVPLSSVGDDHRIDWGKLFLNAINGRTYMASSYPLRQAFAAGNSNLQKDETRMPRAASDNWPVIAWESDPMEVRSDTWHTAVFLAYDDEFAIEYFGRPLQAAWRTNSDNWFDDYMKVESNREIWEAIPKYKNFDKKLIYDWKPYGQDFVNLATLSYRQSLAAHKLVKDIDGTLLMFSKENFSNGCIGTVDVMYPACPIFLVYNPALLKANMEPIMQYASMPRWKWKFAPHDLGTYPKANGQVYGGGEKTEENQMPVEESGNMLIMAAAYLDKSGDKAWIEKYWPKFTEWAEYLKDYGLDPGNQLCTDDFAGHLAHNANLSVKAIVAMACYSKMCGVLGKTADQKRWADLSKTFVKNWLKMADNGDHYRLAFDKEGSWSQKYNLVWDKVLDLKLFPQEVYDKEVAWYLKHQNKYGLPLDSRADYTKLDWIVWTACLTSKKEDFEAIMAPLYKWMNETPDRIPLTDWFDTKTGKCVGFRARSVVGGVFMPLLLNKK